MSSYVPPHKRPGRRGPSRQQESRGTQNSVECAVENASPLAQLTSDEAKIRARAARFTAPKTPDSSFGLVSRGQDSRLQADRKSQQALFDTTQRQFIAHCDSRKLGEIGRSVVNAKLLDEPCDDPGLDHILMSLRKLREALLKNKADAFTQEVFIFAARASALVSDYKAYQPALLHVLYTLHPRRPLPNKLLIQLSSLYAYHLVHFAEQYEAAAKMLHELIPQERRPALILRAVVGRDPVSWSYLVACERDPLLKRFLSRWKQAVFKDAIIDTMSKSYMSLPRAYAEWVLGHDAVKTKWRVDNDTVIIRDRRR